MFEVIQTTFSHFVDFVAKNHDVHKSKINLYKEKENDLKAKIKVLQEQMEKEKKKSA